MAEAMSTLYEACGASTGTGEVVDRFPPTLRPENVCA
jgi:hypothetical protein